MIASIGTPFGFSNSGDSDAHCVAGVVKRLFGCAAFSVDAGVHGRPCQSTRLGRRRIVVPFPPRRAVGPQRHVGEDRVALDHVERGRIRLPARPGHDAEEPGFRVHRPQPSVRRRGAATRCRRRPSSPSSPAAPWAAPASPGWSCRTPRGTRPRRSASVSADPRRPRISMCSAIQPSFRASQLASRSAMHFLPSSALPP